ncbi:MAG: amidohydrolase family protein [Singulisphaera sp.]
MGWPRTTRASPCRSCSRSTRQSLRSRAQPRACIPVGVRVAFGTDAGVYPHGLNAREFAVMVKLDAPDAGDPVCNAHAAELLGRPDQVGVIEPGRFADIIAVSGDPTTVVTELEHIRFVMKGGKVVKNDLKPSGKSP